MEVLLHSSDPPDPWGGYRACLSELPDCTHVLIIQDDTIVCENFAGAVDAISYSNKDHPVCLFFGGYPQGTARMMRRASMRKQSYLWMHRSPIIPLVAVLWPRYKAEEFLHWSDTAKGMTRADDGNAGKWTRETGQDIRVCVPSLVEHPDMEPSVKGGQKSRWGKDPMRKAVLWADDGLAHQW